MAASLGGFEWIDMVAKIAKPAANATALKAFLCRSALSVVMVSACAGAVVGGNLAFTSPAVAQTGGFPGSGGEAMAPYQVSEVEVDATADNAVKAREKALAQGQVAALRTLLQRMVDPANYGSLPNPSVAEVEQMVLGVSIREEKTSAVRYVGKIDVLFMPQAVQELLERSNVPHIQGTERPMIVLPVWQGGADSPMVLWEEPNPWREAWAMRTHGGLVATEVPLGDFSDLSLIDVDRAKALDEQALAAITERYAAEGAMVVEAIAQNPGQDPGQNPAQTGVQPAQTGAVEPAAQPNALAGGASSASVGADALPTLAIRVRQSSLSGNPTLSLTVTPKEGETMTELMQRAVEETTMVIDRSWKQQALAFSGPVVIQTVVARFDTFQDWLKIRASLERAQMVRDWSVSRLTKAEADLEISYAGDAEELSATLSRSGIAFFEGAAGWTLMHGLPQAEGMSPAAGAPVMPSGQGGQGTDLPTQQGTVVVQ